MSKIGINSWFGVGLPLEQRFRLIRAAGFDSVCFWWGDHDTELWGESKQQHFAALRELGLAVDNVHASYIKCNDLWRADAAGDAYEALLAECIADCARFGVPVVVFHGQNQDFCPTDLRAGVARLRRLTEQAAAGGVSLAVENTNHPQLCADLLQAIPNPAFGVCLDCGHWFCYDASFDFAQQYGARIKLLHIHDNDGTGDQHLLPGNGKLPFAEFVQKMRALDYAGVWSFESMATAQANPEAFLTACVSAARNLTICE